MNPGKKKQRSGTAPRVNYSKLKVLFKHSVDDYSPQEVAQLAVQIGGDATTAAKRALEVLSAAEHVLDERWLENNKNLLFASEVSRPFLKAVTEMTGHTDEEYATSKYRAFLQTATIKGKDQKAISALAEKVIRHQRKVGIPQLMVLLLQPFFRQVKLKSAPPPRKKMKNSS